jgi:hypothetical protein
VGNTSTDRKITREASFDNEKELPEEEDTMWS